MTSFVRPSGAMTHITNTFKQHEARHSANPGVDYSDGKAGHPVLAPDSGTVTVGKSSLVGYWVHIDHDGKGQWGWGSDLLHNSKLLVKTGQWVKRGQKIAVSGGTGSVATGPHIHWSLRHAHGHILQNYKNVNGELYVAKTTTAPVPAGQRRTKGVVVNVRPLPTTKSKATALAKANTNYVVIGYVHGEKVSSNDVWYKLKNGSYAWSGGFTSTATTGLKNLTVVTPPVVTPPTGPTQAQYDAVVKERDTLKAALAAAQAVIAAIKKALG